MGRDGRRGGGWGADSSMSVSVRLPTEDVVEIFRFRFADAGICTSDSLEVDSFRVVDLRELLIARVGSRRTRLFNASKSYFKMDWT